MQRCFFLLIFSACFYCTKAQELDINTLELSFWFDENIPQKVHARSLISLQRFNASQVQFDFYPEEINYVKLREGRLKNDLKFNQSQGKLTIETRSIPTGVCEIEIDYFLDLDSKPIKSFINQEQVPLGFNLGNLVAGSKVGKSGVFFPARNGDAFLLKANISMAKKINCGLPATLQYVVNQKGQYQSQFWASKNQILSEEFYLVLGDFKEFDESEFQEELEMEAISFEERLAEEAKKSMQELFAYLNHLGIETTGKNWEAKELLALESLAERNTSKLWVKEENTNSRWAKNQFVRDQMLFLKATDGDVVRASIGHLEYLTLLEGQNWRNEFLENEWEKWKEGKSENQNLALTTYVLEWISKTDSSSFLKFVGGKQDVMLGIEWQIGQTIITNNKIPEIEIEYFYKDNKENLIILQKDTLARPIPVVYNFLVFDTQGKDLYKGSSKGTYRDTLSFPQTGAPRAVLFEYEEGFPANFAIPKSDNYDLFLYAKSENDKQKKAALYRLFETKNVNLYSTVLGIAMESKEAEIRLEAANRAEVLGVTGQFKLKTLLQDLAKFDKDPEVRKQAKMLVGKYYQNK